MKVSVSNKNIQLAEATLANHYSPESNADFLRTIADLLDGTDPLLAELIDDSDESGASFSGDDDQKRLRALADLLDGLR